MSTSSSDPLLDPDPDAEEFDLLSEPEELPDWLLELESEPDPEPESSLEAGLLSFSSLDSPLAEPVSGPFSSFLVFGVILGLNNI
jgi:hypothetical protein